MRVFPTRCLMLLSAVCICFAGCAGGSGDSESAERPNVLLIVWDTVRADRLSIHDPQRQTTPLLSDWARAARVFDNCISVGSTTVPAHVSLFTGLLPAEHGLSNDNPYLADEFATLAESLKDAGYRTYMFGENPYVSSDNNFGQGFDLEEHPWSERFKSEALRITLEKRFPKALWEQAKQRYANTPAVAWSVTSAGELAQRGLGEWLAQSSGDKPFFAFINFMEAHRPLIPPRRFRKQTMTPEQIRASYQMDLSFDLPWPYIFRLRDAEPGEIELNQAIYDAALLELDELLNNLLASLEASGQLDNTVIALVADHGEHLGEHHMIDHQFSVYQPLMHVPLVLHYPKRVPAGRETRPVMNIDLFPTLLELAGLTPPTGSKARSLLDPVEDRPRLGAYPQPMRYALHYASKRDPQFDAAPWKRSLRAFYSGPYKLIYGSDGRHELYDLSSDPDELNNLIDQRPELADRLLDELNEYVASLKKVDYGSGTTTRPVSDEQRKRLEALGYVGGEEEEEGDGDDPP